MDIKVLLLQWFITAFLKKTSGGVTTFANKSAVKNENMSHENQLRNYTNKCYQKIQEKKSTLNFSRQYRGANFAYMEIISKFNEGFRFLLRILIIDIYGKYPWLIPLQGEKGITITKAFQKI